MAQQVLELANYLAAQRQVVNEQQQNPPQQQQQAPPQVQFAEQPQFIEYQGDEYDENDQGAKDFHRTYILDSGSSPSHVHLPFTNTQQLPSPTVVSTPDGSFTVRRKTTVPLPLQCGVLHADALVHPALKANLISPIPVARQVGPVLLTASQASVLPKSHPATAKALYISQPISAVKHGVYNLYIPRKQTHKALGARSNNPTPCKYVRKDTPRTPSSTVFFSTNVRKRKSTQIIGVAPSKKCRPILKTSIAHPKDKLYYDYHLLLNHTSPKTILNTIINPPYNSPNRRKLQSPTSPVQKLNLKRRRTAAKNITIGL